MTVTSKRLLSALGCGTVSFLHLSATFVAWSLHPGNRPTLSGEPGWFAAHGFSVLSAPLFSLFSDELLTDHFWGALFANSLLWGIGITLSVIALLRRLNRPTTR